MWSQRINIADLRKIDAAVRSIINDVYAKHKNQMNSILYFSKKLRRPWFTFSRNYIQGNQAEKSGKNYYQQRSSNTIGTRI